MGVHVKFVWDKFSTLSLAVLVRSVNAWHAQARPQLELIFLPVFHPVNLSLTRQKRHVLALNMPSSSLTKKKRFYTVETCGFHHIQP